MTVADIDKNTFTVVVQGAELAEEDVARICEAVRRSALAEVAALDLRGKELVFRPVMTRMLADDIGGGGGGGTGGAQIELRSPSA